MTRRAMGLMLLVSCFAFGSVAHAEPAKTIVLKIYDGKSMHQLMPTGYQVRVDHQTMLHPDWVKQNEDGSAVLTIPADAEVVALHLAYDNSMELYVACDADKNAFGDVWYHVPEIMQKGVVTPNGCGKAKVNAKFKTTAAPGELILFVRERGFKDRAREIAQ
jgi:hypothetical protein